MSEEYETVIYVGAIDYAGYHKLTTEFEKSTATPRGRRGLLVLVTTGGNADAAYRIARALGHYYPDDLRVLIPDICKSAGTLIAIGANELIICDRGELGPLDVQIAKKDEMFEVSSGLDIVQSINHLQATVRDAFRDYLMDMRLGGGLGTKIASELASTMATSLVAPILSQIDPMKIGEHLRALSVAKEYGDRLNGKFRNARPGAIDRLLSGYPEHSFVIDRKEASDLFQRVRAPNADELQFEATLRAKYGEISHAAHSPPQVIRICPEELTNETQPDGDSESATDAQGNSIRIGDEADASSARGNGADPRGSTSSVRKRPRGGTRKAIVTEH